MRRLLRGVALGLVLSAHSAHAQTPAEPTATQLMDDVMWGRNVGGAFALIDHTGRPRTDADFRGQLMLIYFGFTYCPDICPTDLQTIGLALDQLGPAAEGVQPLFITLDPERDTPAHLAQYVSSFHPRLMALSGNAASIKQAAAAYKVYYAKAPTSHGDYTIDHSAFIYIVDRDGRYLGFFPPGTSSDRLVAIIRPHLSR